jgi:hypothetical protein
MSDNQNSNPFDKAVDDLDMEHIDGVDCYIVHPLLDEFMENLSMAPEHTANAWSYLLTPVQGQLRSCIATEVLEIALREFSVQYDVMLQFTPADFQRMVVLICTFAWGAYDHIKPVLEE